MNITVYIFSEMPDDLGSLLSEGKKSGIFPFEEVRVREDLIPAGFTVRAFLQRDKESRPPWIEYFEQILDYDFSGMTNRSNSLVVLIKGPSFACALTTGYGYTALERSRLKDDAGLHIVRNILDPSRLTAIETLAPSPAGRKTQVVLGTEGYIHEMGARTREEPVTVLAGKPESENGLSRISGADSLHITSREEFLPFLDILKNLIEQEGSTAYRQKFPQLAAMEPVTDLSLRADLDRTLADLLAEDATDRLFFVRPRSADWNRVAGYSLNFASRITQIQELSTREILSIMHQWQQDELRLELVSVIEYDAGGDPLAAPASLREYCVAEVDHRENRYLLMRNNWYPVPANLTQELAMFFEGVDEIDIPGYLPPMIAGETEGDYNARVPALKPDLLCLDKDNIHITGHTAIEACDLLSTSGHFICVKKATGSATLSHLWNQGMVSAGLLAHNEEYRGKILEKCPTPWNTLFTTSGVQPATITFVYAVASARSGKLAPGLPLFSQIALRDGIRNLREEGFGVALYRIDIQ